MNKVRLPSNWDALHLWCGQGWVFGPANTSRNKTKPLYKNWLRRARIRLHIYTILLVLFFVFSWCRASPLQLPYWQWRTIVAFHLRLIQSKWYREKASVVLSRTESDKFARWIQFAFTDVSILGVSDGRVHHQSSGSPLHGHQMLLYLVLEWILNLPFVSQNNLLRCAQPYDASLQKGCKCKTDIWKKYYYRWISKYKHFTPSYHLVISINLFSFLGF